MLNDFQSGKALTSLKKHPVAIALLSAFAASPLLAIAEESTMGNDEGGIEVVTVTAQKRVQNILKVPLTVGTVSDSMIEESGSISLSDVDKFIPGFDFTDSNMTQAGITMRGISSPNISVGGDPSSATFYDDIYMPRAAQGVVFSDMARIEVLKGPQGTLFGRNAAMGVVNMVPKSPIADFEGFIKGSYGTDNLQRIEGMVNIPITDSFYMRANFLSNTQDGVIENVANTSWNDKGYKQWDLGERDHNAARISFLWDISDTTNFQLSYDVDDLEQGPPMAVGVSEFAYNNGKSAFSSKAENDVRNGVEARDMYGVTAKLNHEFNDQWSMKYVLGFRDWETENRQDEDGTADITRYFDTSNNEDSDILYTELQINYVSNKINAVAGFSYSKEKVKQTTELNLTADTAARLITGDLNAQINGLVAAQVADMLGGNTDAHAEGAFGPGVTFEGAVQTLKSVMGIEDMDHMWNPDDWAGALNGLGLAEQIMAAIGMPGVPLTADIVSATGNLTYDIVSAQLPGLVGSSAPYIPEIFGPSYAGQFWRESINNTGDFTNWGVFADVDYAINDKWNIIAGLRYSKDDKDFTWDIPVNSFSTVPTNSLMPAGIQVPIGNILFPQVNLAASDSWSKVTGRLVTSYQINDDQMVFASYSTGYKSGGFDSLSPSTKSFAPEDSTNYEIGYKAVLWDEVIANISAYYLELDNLQRSIDSKAPGNSQAIPTIINEDREITGVEFDLRWHVSKSITAGVVSEIRSTEFISPDYYNGEGDLVAAAQTSSNAKANYTFSLDWMPDFGVGTTNFHLDYVFLKNTNGDRVGIEDYKKAVDAYFEDTELLNARLSWASSNDKLELGLWGKNLLDNRYVNSIGGLTADILGTPHGYINRGLEVGVDVKYSF
ncbi:TonB-dependent receptor [Thalassotalea piscium]|uniref:Outer membrane receptor protein involved in Fe transport n=1 Tax=Thalassotalea piscium TaxID=1230533 RepID=A0A7X0TV61_9GAMM|nr:TonB-dependent receptor [Thalassotalea piscium]MBB6544918.1 outer membrane receptor protein involved in Fe transport [Thalassotalea piscium]